MNTSIYFTRIKKSRGHMRVTHVHACVTACGAVPARSRGQRASSPRAPPSPHVRPRARGSRRHAGGAPSRREQSRAGRGAPPSGAPAAGVARCRVSRPQTPPQNLAACQGDLIGVINPFIAYRYVVARGRGAAREPPSLIRSPRRFAERPSPNEALLHSSERHNAFWLVI